MYKCDVCGSISKPREACHIVVRETREKVYTKIVKKVSRDETYEKKIETKGHEVVKEQKLCIECLSKEVLVGARK